MELTQEYILRIHVYLSTLRIVPKFIEKQDSRKVGHALETSQWPRTLVYH